MKKITLNLIVLMLSVLLISANDSFAVRYSIDVKNYEFSPSSLPNIKIGDTIHFEWKNGSHTTTSTTIPAGAASWDNPMNSTNITFDYIPIVAGVYNYKCTPHASAGMVGQFTVVTIAGIGENNPATRITLYPNPFRDKVYLNCKSLEGVFIKHLTIYDILGKRIREESYTEQSTFPDYFNLSDVPEGLIVFELTDNLNHQYYLRGIRKR